MDHRHAMPDSDLLQKRSPCQKLDDEVVSDSSSYDDAKKTKGTNKGWVPRPPNAFILYRSETQPKLVEKYRGMGKSSRDFSAMVGQMWRNETSDIRQKFVDMAALRLRLHRESYPNYKYSPKKKPRKSVKPSTKSKPRPGRRLRGNCGDADSDCDGSIVNGEDDSDFAPSSPVYAKGFERQNIDRSEKVVTQAAQSRSQEYHATPVHIKLEPTDSSAQTPSSLPSTCVSSVSPSNSRASSVASFNPNFNLLSVTDNHIVDKAPPLDEQLSIRANHAIASASFTVPLASVMSYNPPPPILRESFSSFSDWSSFLPAPSDNDYSAAWDHTRSLVEHVESEKIGSSFNHLKRESYEFEPNVVPMQDIFPNPGSERSAFRLSTSVWASPFACPTRRSPLMETGDPLTDIFVPPFFVPSSGSGNPAGSGSGKRNARLSLDTSAARQVTNSVSDKLSLWLMSAKTLSPLTAVAGSGGTLSDDSNEIGSSTSQKDGREWDAGKAEGMLSATTPRAALFGKFRSLFGGS